MNTDPNSLYDASYYAHGCGRPYQRDPEWLGFFAGIAKRIQTDIGPKTVLDAGCALGFLVEGLCELGVEGYGVDISEFAIQNAHESIHPYVWAGSVTEPFPQKYDLIVSIEVLEHMPKLDAEEAIRNFCRHADDILFSSTPFDYKEATHLNVQPPEYWAEQFAKCGFFRDVDFDASFITQWAVRYRRLDEPVHRIAKNYERKYWLLWKENTDLRKLILEMRSIEGQLDQAQNAIREQQQTILSQQESLNREHKVIQDLKDELSRLSQEVLGWHNHWMQVEKSMSWRFTQALVRLKPRLAPAGSSREKLLLWSFNTLRSMVRWLRGKPVIPPVQSPQSAQAEVQAEPQKIMALDGEGGTPALKVAFYTTDLWIGASAHLRIVGPAQFSSSGITLMEGSRWEPEARLFFHEDADVVLIQRDFPSRPQYNEVMTWARENNKPVLYELDDLLVELPADHPEREHYAAKRGPMVQAMMEAGGVIVSTLALAEYARRFNPNVWVLPNYLNDRIWNLKSQLPPKGRTPVIIGYMGGHSKTHLPDINMVAPVLERLLQRHGSKLQLDFWGVVPPALLNYPNIRPHKDIFINYEEFANYFSQQKADIFIAPLVDNLFNRCKSHIKFLEYSSLGVPGVYSQVAPYENLVSDGINGFLAATEAQWEEALEKLIADHGLRAKVGAFAQRTVQDFLLMSKNAEQWGTIYRAAVTNAHTAHSEQTCQSARFYYELWKNK